MLLVLTGGIWTRNSCGLAFSSGRVLEAWYRQSGVAIFFPSGASCYPPWVESPGFGQATASSNGYEYLRRRNGRTRRPRTDHYWNHCTLDLWTQETSRTRQGIGEIDPGLQRCNE